MGRGFFTPKMTKGPTTRLDAPSPATPTDPGSNPEMSHKVVWATSCSGNEVQVLLSVVAKGSRQVNPFNASRSATTRGQPALRFATCALAFRELKTVL